MKTKMISKEIAVSLKHGQILHHVSVKNAESETIQFTLQIVGPVGKTNLSTITGRPVLLYGQTHVVADKAEDSDFDCMYFGKDVAEILVKVKSDFNERITLAGFGGTADDALETLETLYHLNQATTEIEMRAWFQKYYAYYDFSIFSQEL